LDSKFKLLLVGSGSPYSTFDVEQGYLKALRGLGHDVGYYALDKRIVFAEGYHEALWRRLGKPQEGKPTPGDTLYVAGEEILQRAAYYKVDWVIVVAGRLLHPNVWHALRNVGIKTCLIGTENPYDDPFYAELAPLVNVLTVNERSSVAPLQAASLATRVAYLRHAYDPERHHPGAEAAGVPAHDVVFVGSDFPERVRTLAAVDWSGVDLALYGNWRATRSRKVKAHVRGGIQANVTTAALYRKAKIGLNLYRSGQGWGRDTPPVARADSLNPRALELAACGAFQISDYRPEVAEVFGDAVPTFRTPGELQELVRYYLAHADERQALAARLPGLVAGQTYESRARQLTAILTGA
jgi:spore maturation protein CgeB